MRIVDTTLPTIYLKKLIREDKFDAQRKISGNIKPLLKSLFCGTGGSSLGYKNAGFEEVLAVDMDNHAQECFQLNFPEVPFEKWDISQKSATDYLDRLGMKPGELDFFDASSPCDGYSRSNVKSKLYCMSNMLLLKMVQLIAEQQPKMFLLENVTGLKDKRNRGIYLELERRLAMLNYVWEIKVVKAEEYGVPQARRRVIVIGVRKDVYRVGLGDKSLFPKPDTKNVKNMALNKILPDVLGYSPGQFQDKFTHASKPICTITASPSLWIYQLDGKRRKPIPTELKLLSTFPEDFILTGSDNKQWERIGNAVPPKLTESLARHLKDNFLIPYLSYGVQYESFYGRLKNNSDWFREHGFRDYNYINKLNKAA